MSAPDPHLATRRLPTDVICSGVRWGGAQRTDGGFSHRLSLDYTFTGLLASQRRGRLNVCMLNPSGARHDASDATITRVLGFARATSYAEVRILNRWPYRATEPAALVKAIERGDDVGEDQPWEELIDEGANLLVGWGKPKESALARRLRDTTTGLVDRWRLHGLPRVGERHGRQRVGERHGRQRVGARHRPRCGR